MSTPEKLSQDDITRLMQDPSSAAQMEVVNKLAAQYTGESQALAGGESLIAEDIFNLLLSRAEVQVRALIARNLKEAHKLPPEIAKKMASDVREVALPIIQHSKALSDDDLLKIITESKDDEKLIAIAKRETVSETVSDALVETKVEQVVSTLVRNEGAQIAETTFEKIVENHATSAQVMESMLERGSVPVVIVEKLVERISGSLKQSLEAKYGNLVDLTELRKAFDKSLELTGLKLMGLKTPDAQLTRLITYLSDKGQLSPFSALCMANLPVFEASMARLVRIPLKNVQQLLQDPQGLKALYDKAELPESMFEAVDICVKAINELESEGKTPDGHKPLLSPFQVMERMRRNTAGRQVENLDYMLSMMQQHTRDNIRYQSAGAAG